MRLLLVLALCASSLFVQAQGKSRKAPERILKQESMKEDTVRVEEYFTEKSGQVVSRRFYVGTRPVGIWQEFDRNGKLTAERDFSMLHYGSPSKVEPEVVPSDSVAMTVVSEMPQFPGGEAELFKFLGRNTRYPQEAADAGLSGTVYITGMVDKDGNWTTTSILRGAHPYLDFEAWRVTDLFPAWSPGKVDGEPVKVQYNLPIRFTLR